MKHVRRLGAVLKLEALTWMITAKRHPNKTWLEDFMPTDFDKLVTYVLGSKVRGMRVQTPASGHVDVKVTPTLTVLHCTPYYCHGVSH